MLKTTCFYIGIFLLLASLPADAQIKRVRLNFHSPENLNRELLLGFTPNNEATDGFDYGYDGGVPDSWPSDLNWLIEENRFVIQGVGTYEETKTYPFWLGLTNVGISSISLISTENFTEDVTVYILDSATNTYHNISDQSLDLNLPPAEYSGRFFIAFQEPSESGGTLSLSDYDDEPNVGLTFSAENNTIVMSPRSGTQLLSVNVLNSIGQRILTKKLNSNSQTSLHLPFLQSQVLLVEIMTDKGRLIKRILI
ncbi:MAG: hypothetical protein HKM99_06625 [Flavobacteriaceae bacterium]|nr:hypothetical protein [Flavobacteriaceae bacterium]